MRNGTLFLLSLCLLAGCQMTTTTTWNGEPNNVYTTVMIPSLGGGAPALTVLEVNGTTAGVWAGSTFLAEVAGAAGAATAGFVLDYGSSDITVNTETNVRPGRPRPHRGPRDD